MAGMFGAAGGPGRRRRAPRHGRRANRLLASAGGNAPSLPGLPGGLPNLPGLGGGLPPGFNPFKR